MITAERLNEMQKEPLIVTETVVDYVGTLDKTWKEIHDAILSGTTVLFDEISYGVEDPTLVVSESYIPLMIRCDSYLYYVDKIDGGNAWSCNTETDYPSYYYGD